MSSTRLGKEPAFYKEWILRIVEEELAKKDLKMDLGGRETFDQIWDKTGRRLSRMHHVWEADNGKMWNAASVVGQQMALVAKRTGAISIGTNEVIAAQRAYNTYSITPYCPKNSEIPDIQST